MLAKKSCSWCHKLGPINDNFCAYCGHSLRFPRMECDCPQCKSPIPVEDWIPEMPFDAADYLDRPEPKKGPKSTP